MSDQPTMTELLEHHARHDRRMLIYADEPRSFADVLDSSRRLAGKLIELGVEPGDRVAVWLPTTPMWWETLFACARIGAIVVSVNPRYVARELADVLSRSGAKVVVMWPGFHKIDFAGILAACALDASSPLTSLIVHAEASDVERPLPGRFRVVTEQEIAATAPFEGVRSDASTPCIIFTTSGTTSAPKFVLHSQRSLVGHARDVVRVHGFDEASVLVLAPPICGAFGCCLAMAMAVAGRPVIAHPVWDPAHAARQIERHQATHMHAVDDAIAQTLAFSSGTPAFPSLRYCGFGAFNPARSDVVELARDRGLVIVGMYGTSEIQGLFARQDPAAPLPKRGQAGGYPVSSLVRARARDPETGAPCGRDEPGALEIFAPTSRMIGYFGDPQATAAAFTDDGFYRTGDLGMVHADGSLTFIGRVGDTMRLGGFLVSPKEIEAVIEQQTGRACQVVEVLDGGSPRAFAFVLGSPAELDEPTVIAACSANLARYKVPCRIVSIESFPMAEGTNGDKVQKKRLRAMAQQIIDAR